MARHFLYLTNFLLTSFIVDGSRITAKESFSTSDPNVRDFERHLVKHRRSPIHLVLDLTEEDYRSETIPHVRGADQEAILNRRLGQIYRNSPYRHAIVQGREPEGRRDDRVLYHGVPNADLVKPWLAIIERLEVPLSGIYSAPVLSGLLLQTLDVFFPHTLLVSLSSGHGLRQTYFQNKHVKFSRLTQLQSSEDEGFGVQVAQECSKTWQYLDSLRFLSGDDQLEVCILVPKELRAEVGRAIKDYPLLQFRILEMDDVASALKLKHWQDGQFADELLVSLFARSRIQNHFAQPDQTRVARLQRFGVGLHALSATLLAGSAIGAVVMLAKAQQLSMDAERMQSQSASLGRQYQSLMSQMQTAQVSADTSRDAASFAAEFLEPTTSPSSILTMVSKVLSRHPEINVVGIGWKRSVDENAKAPDSQSPERNPLPVRTESSSSTSDTRDSAGTGGLVSTIVNQLQGNSSDVVVPGTDFQIVVLDATTGPFTGNYRELLDKMNAFVADLGRLPGSKATLMTPPLDIRPEASIRARLTDSQTVASQVPFKVRLVVSRTPSELHRGK